MSIAWLHRRTKLRTLRNGRYDVHTCLPATRTENLDQDCPDGSLVSRSECNTPNWTGSTQLVSLNTLLLLKDCNPRRLKRMQAKRARLVLVQVGRGVFQLAVASAHRESGHMCEHVNQHISCTTVSHNTRRAVHTSESVPKTARVSCSLQSLIRVSRAVRIQLHGGRCR